MQNPLFLKIGLRSPVLTNSREKVFELNRRNLLGVDPIRQRNETQKDWNNLPHEMSILTQFSNLIFA